RQGQRLAYAVLTLAERGNTPSHRRPRRTDGQGEALDARRGDRPAMGRQPWLERPEGADDDAGLHVAQAPAPPGLHHWRREEPGPGPPARLRPRAWCARARWLDPLAVGRQPRRRGLLAAIGEAERP